MEIFKLRKTERHNFSKHIGNIENAKNTDFNSKE